MALRKHLRGAIPESVALLINRRTQLEQNNLINNVSGSNTGRLDKNKLMAFEKYIYWNQRAFAFRKHNIPGKSNENCFTISIDWFYIALHSDGDDGLCDEDEIMNDDANYYKNDDDDDDWTMIENYNTIESQK